MVNLHNLLRGRNTLTDGFSEKEENLLDPSLLGERSVIRRSIPGRPSVCLLRRLVCFARSSVQSNLFVRHTTNLNRSVELLLLLSVGMLAPLVCPSLSAPFAFVAIGVVALQTDNSLPGKGMSLTELARAIGVSSSSVWRWSQRGVRGIRLETYCVGGRRFVDPRAYDRFCLQCTAVSSGKTPEIRTNRQRATEISRAEQELKGEGI